MALTFANTHNMIAFLTKSDASEGFEKIINFLNASVIQYELMVKPTINVSFIKQVWSSVSLKKTNDVVRLQALIDRRKVIIPEDMVRQALRLDDADSIDCLPNEEIFIELDRMGVDSPLFEGMFVPQLVHDDIDAAAEDEDVAEPTQPSPTPATTQPPPQKELISSPPQVAPTLPPSPHKSPTAQPSSPPPQQPSQPSHTTDISMDLLNILLETWPTLTRKVENLEQDKIAQALEITKLKRMHPNRGGGEIAKIDVDKDVTLEEVAAEVIKDAEVQARIKESQPQVYYLDLEHAQKVLSMQDDEAEPIKLKEVIEVVTTAKLMTKVVTVAATTITAAVMPKVSTARRIKGVVIRDPEETATPSVIVHSKPKSKDKGKGILVEEPKPLKKQAHIEHDEVYARELEAEINANINWNEVIEQVKRKQKQDNTVMRYQALKRKPQTKAQARKNIMELEEEASKQGKRKSKTSKEKAGKKQKLDEEVEELKTHQQILVNDEDDVYTEATPLALKVFIVDYQIHTQNNKPYYKISRADGTHQLCLSFISLLRNFDKEDLEMPWKIAQERFAPLEPKNFSYDFLLNTLKTMFKKPKVEDHIWKNQKGSYGLEKVKSWKLLESCGFHIITFTTTQMILLVERRYYLTGFTLDQMLNNVRLEVEAESEVLLELLRFIRR
uniref:Xylulose kinase-1 n=1 Tax=Tanacetum cinerariifolium TaxID=118510 RepID=A0A6L2KGY4_TANCI|nr:hypothetical protein [Tanacetum cinerariifolium]